MSLSPCLCTLRDAWVGPSISDDGMSEQIPCGMLAMCPPCMVVQVLALLLPLLVTPPPCQTALQVAPALLRPTAVRYPQTPGALLSVLTLPACRHCSLLAHACGCRRKGGEQHCIAPRHPTLDAAFIPIFAVFYVKFVLRVLASSTHPVPSPQTSAALCGWVNPI